jgi:hypothetical protein
VSEFEVGQLIEFWYNDKVVFLALVLEDATTYYKIKVLWAAQKPDLHMRFVHKENDIRKPKIISSKI